MQLITSGKGIDLTSAIEEYVTKKIGPIDKFYDRIVRAHVTVGIDSNHHVKGKKFFAECKLEVPGPDIFVMETDEDLYAAIDIMRKRIEDEIKKHKEKFDMTSQDKIDTREEKEYKEE
jgi:putative sigma-54 modulation protein